MLREKAFGTFKVVALALEAGLLQSVGDFLIFDEAQGSVRPCLALLLHFSNTVTNLIEHRPFLQSAPCSHKTHSGDAIAIGFLARFGHRRP